MIPSSFSSVWIIWHVKAITSALSGAQPSKKAAPQPGEDGKHRSSSPLLPGLASVVLRVWWKMVFMPCKNVVIADNLPNS